MRSSLAGVTHQLLTSRGILTLPAPHLPQASGGLLGPWQLLQPERQIAIKLLLRRDRFQLNRINSRVRTETVLG